MSSDSNPDHKTHIKVCHGRACSGRFSKYTLERAEVEIEKNGQENITCETCACQGNCEKGTTVVIEKGAQSQTYSQVDPIKMADLIRRMKA